MLLYLCGKRLGIWRWSSASGKGAKRPAPPLASRSTPSFFFFPLKARADSVVFAASRRTCPFFCPQTTRKQSTRSPCTISPKFAASRGVSLVEKRPQGAAWKHDDLQWRFASSLANRSLVFPGSLLPRVTFNKNFLSAGRGERFIRGVLVSK